MRELEISNYEVQPLNNSEKLKISAGLPWWVPAGAGAWVLNGVVNNWADVKKGFSDGFNLE